MYSKNNRKVINAWCMYDWANSVYSLVISSTIFPAYYEKITSGINGSDQVNFFGIDVSNTVLYSYSISFAFLLAAILTPLLSGIADIGSRRKTFMKFFTYVGGISCIALYFFTGENVEWAIIFSTLACTGYAGSLVFYNSFLPIIATPEKFDFYSARGYSYGYIGSVLLLVFNIFSIFNHNLLGITVDEAQRLSFLLVGAWWISFAQISFYHLPEGSATQASVKKLITKGLSELSKVWRMARQNKVLRNFLIAFFFYNTGVQTVMYLATLFGSKELDLPTGDLITAILIIQVVAIGGAYFFAQLSKKSGNKVSLLVMVFIWIFVCLIAYFITTANEFYGLALIVGIVMGGIQSLSRATYSKLIPTETADPTSYFSFYDFLDKMSIVTGAFSYGLIEQLTGGMRNSTLALGLYFLVGMGFLLLIKVPLNKELVKKPGLSTLSQ